MERLACVRDDQWQVLGVPATRVQQPGRLGVTLQLEPLEWHLVAGQEVFDLMRRGRPAVADDPDALVRPEPVLHLPILEEVVEHRIELLLRRIPRLQQVVVNIGPIDGGNGRIGIGVGGEKNAPGLGVKLAGLFEKLDPGHLRHAMVGEQQADAFVAELELSQGFQAGGTGLGPANPVVLAVALAQIARQRPRHVGIVVDSQKDRWRHRRHCATVWSGSDPGHSPRLATRGTLAGVSPGPVVEVVSSE